MRRSTWSVPMTVALLAAFAGGSVLADTPVDRTVPLTGRMVSIEMISGTLTVEGGSGRDVVVKGVLRHRCEEMEVDSDSEGVSIEVDWVCDGTKKGSYAYELSELTVRIPEGADLSVETISAPITISGVEGVLDIETISGTLEVHAESKSIDLASVSGPIRLVSTVPLDDAGIESVSGPIDAEIDPAPGATVDIESVSGSVVLKLPAGASASFDMSTFSGKITNALGPQAVKTSQYLPSSELSFTMGGGGARIKIETLSGRIDIRGR